MILLLWIYTLPSLLVMPSQIHSPAPFILAAFLLHGEHGNFSSALAEQSEESVALMAGPRASARWGGGGWGRRSRHVSIRSVTNVADLHMHVTYVWILYEHVYTREYA